MENETNAFRELGIDERFLPVLKGLGFKEPTPIQKEAIPPALAGRDVLGIAQTGTGKTLAFGIPLIERLGELGRGLILAPTRELAEQIVKEFAKVKKTFHIEAVAIVGGASMFPQIRALLKKPRLIVATPGRLSDHLRQGNLKLDDIQVVVLDEADRMLDFGFEPQVQDILKHIPAERQTLLFSATVDQRVGRIVSNYMKDPVRIEIARSGTVAQGLTQELYILPQDRKEELLLDLLEKYRGRSTLVFMRTRMGAAKLRNRLHDRKFAVAEIHSDRTQGQRRMALDGFKRGRYKILVATDVAARGLDIGGIDLVVNYDMPDEDDSYVHRIGRTARAGGKGMAVTFATPMQGYRVREIEKYIDQQIPVCSHDTIQVAPGFSEKSLKPAKKSRNRKKKSGGFGGEKKGFASRSKSEGRGDGKKSGGFGRDKKGFGQRSKFDNRGERKKSEGFGSEKKSFGPRPEFSDRSEGEKAGAFVRDKREKKEFRPRPEFEKRSDGKKSGGFGRDKKGFGQRSRFEDRGQNKKSGGFNRDKKRFGERPKFEERGAEKSYRGREDRKQKPSFRGPEKKDREFSSFSKNPGGGRGFKSRGPKREGRPHHDFSEMPASGRSFSGGGSPVRHGDRPLFRGGRGSEQPFSKKPSRHDKPFSKKDRDFRGEGHKESFSPGGFGKKKSKKPGGAKSKGGGEGFYSKVKKGVGKPFGKKFRGKRK